MPSTKTITTYSFMELSGRAKDRVRNAYTVDADSITSCFIFRLYEAGYPTQDIQWRLSCSQGDGVAFYSGGRAPDTSKDPWATVGEDYCRPGFDFQKLWRRIAPRLPAKEREAVLALKHKCREDLSVCVEISRNSYGRRYTHAGCMAISVVMDTLNVPDDTDANEAHRIADLLENAISDDTRELCAELENDGYIEIDYLQSDECLADALDGDEFDDHGRRV